MFYSEESGGKTKIPILNIAPAPCPPNSPTDTAVSSIFIICTVIISSTTITTTFPQPICSLPHFLDTYLLV